MKENGVVLSGRIYLRSEKGLVAMVEQKYDFEAHLESLLEDYPDLLAGEQMRPGAPRRWLLVERQAGIEDASGGLARWSLDLLFLDQDAVPTLVEVKRSTDTRARREVVAQMLDYAANAVAHWPSGELRRRFEERSDAPDRDPDAEVLALTKAADTTAVDAYWAAADANLAARRVRLVFVADTIPEELIRIIEFLNDIVVGAEIFAVEVRQFVGEGHQTLVPRVLGRTATQAKQTAPGGSRNTYLWTIEDFVTKADGGGATVSRLVEAALAWLDRHGAPVLIGRGKHGPLYVQISTPHGELVKFASINALGKTMINFGGLASVPPFDGAGLRLELNRRLNSIGSVSIDDRSAANAGWPEIQPNALASEEAVTALFGVFDWVSERLAESPTGRT